MRSSSSSSSCHDDSEQKEETKPSVQSSDVPPLDLSRVAKLADPKKETFDKAWKNLSAANEARKEKKVEYDESEA